MPKKYTGCAGTQPVSLRQSQRPLEINQLT